MTTARLRNRIEAVEDKAGGNDMQAIRLFYVSGGNGIGPNGREGQDLEAFLTGEGHDLASGKCRIVHICPPWDGETKTFTPRPLRDVTARFGAQHDDTPTP